MIFKADNYITLIEEEIKWCKEHNYANLDSSYKEGFIKGLEQAKLLINQTKILR